MKEIVERLKNSNKTISTMESCTGGALANGITNIPGASELLKFGVVTCSNKFRIKLFVSNNDKHNIYGIVNSREMSKYISTFSGSDYGIGVAGMLNNDINEKNKIYISIYDRNNDKYYDYDLIITNVDVIENKKMVIDFVKDKLLKIL